MYFLSIGSVSFFWRNATNVIWDKISKCYSSEPLLLWSVFFLAALAAFYLHSWWTLRFSDNWAILDTKVLIQEWKTQKKTKKTQQILSLNRIRGRRWRRWTKAWLILLQLNLPRLGLWAGEAIGHLGPGHGDDIILMMKWLCWRWWLQCLDRGGGGLQTGAPHQQLAQHNPTTMVSSVTKCSLFTGSYMITTQKRITKQKNQYVQR